MNELRNRGVEDVLIAVVDGLKGFPDAITAVFPQAQVQTCIVHLIRNSLDLCFGLTRPHRGHGPCAPYKDRKAVAADLKEICRAKDADAGAVALEAFAAGEWGLKYPAIALSWRRHWAAVIPFFAFPGDVRRIIYTTDEIDKRPPQVRVTVCGASGLVAKSGASAGGSARPPIIRALPA
jgi:putative transposase